MIKSQNNVLGESFQKVVEAIFHKKRRCHQICNRLSSKQQARKFTISSLKLVINFDKECANLMQDQIDTQLALGAHLSHT